MSRKDSVSEPVRDYLARIGARGGKASRRELSKQQARMMVSVREAVRAAQKEGRKLSERERKRLMIPPAPEVTRPRVGRMSNRAPDWGIFKRAGKA